MPSDLRCRPSVLAPPGILHGTRVLQSWTFGSTSKASHLLRERRFLISFCLATLQRIEVSVSLVTAANLRRTFGSCSGYNPQHYIWIIPNCKWKKMSWHTLSKILGSPHRSGSHAHKKNKHTQTLIPVNTYWRPGQQILRLTKSCILLLTGKSFTINKWKVMYLAVDR